MYRQRFSHKEEDYHENWFYRLWKYGDSHVKGNSEKWRGGSIRYDDKLDLLTEALDALEDANDALNDASDEA